MSLQVSPIVPIPTETIRVAHAAFPKGTLCLQIRDTLGPLYEDAQCAALFSPTGQPAEAPARLALVLILQFTESLSDRQAADAVRGRIDWKYALTLYRVDHTTAYKHINALLTQVVDWDLIERHWPDMMQVALSIQAGHVLPSMLLQKLGVYSRQSSLYKAFSELGRVERTLFLLEYMSDADMRQHIRAETTKVESYHQFTDWIAFGGPVLRSGDPVEQEKRIKYRDLVANAVMLHNVVDMTTVLRALQQEGIRVTPEMVRRLSPYLTEHIKRFGQYMLDMALHLGPLQPQALFVPAA